MKRFFLGCGAALIAVSLLLALSCTKPEEKAAGTVVYSYPANVGPLNPHMYSPNAMFAQVMLYEPLVKLNDDGTIGPALAESWDISPDGLAYTFHLRKDVKFTDGEPFNAKAVELNFKAVMANAGRHEWLGITSKIDKYEAVGEYDFRLTLVSAYYPALDDLAPKIAGADYSVRAVVKPPSVPALSVIPPRHPSPSIGAYSSLKKIFSRSVFDKNGIIASTFFVLSRIK